MPSSGFSVEAMRFYPLAVNEVYPVAMVVRIQ